MTLAVVFRCAIAGAAVSLALDAHADESAYSCQAGASPHVTVTRALGACTGFDRKDEHGTPVHVDFGVHVSGEVLISADGRHVVALQTSLYGGQAKDGSFFAHGADAAAPLGEPVALLIYRDGQRLASYRLSDLLQRPAMVALSVSHVHWLQAKREFAESGGTRLVLDTLSLREITFDLDSGRITAQRDAPQWERCDAIVSGDVALAGNTGSIKAPHVFKGGPTPTLTFTLGPDADFSPARMAPLCLRNTSHGWRYNGQLDELLNGFGG